MASSFTEKLIYLPYPLSYQANDMPLASLPCGYLITNHYEHNNDLAHDEEKSKALPLTGEVAREARQQLRQQCQSRIEGSHTTGEGVSRCAMV